MTVRIITSGAYVGGELEAEFGRVPPAFLPVGASLLIHHQLRRLGNGARTVLSLPDDFTLDAIEAARIAAAGVEVMIADPKLSLGRSIAKLIARIGGDAPIEIVHGDTLIDPIASGHADAMTVGRVSDGYHWAMVQVASGTITAVTQDMPLVAGDPPPHILTGAFRFADPALLLRCLIDADDSFVRALDAYARARPVTAVETEGWLDFGHLQTFFRSRHHLAAARHFNALRINGGVVHKSSEQAFKIDAEARWLRGLPAGLQLYAARLIEDADTRQDHGYATEYAYLPTVAELYLSRLGQPGWQRILDATTEFLDAAAGFSGTGTSDALARLTVDKTRDRIDSARGTLPDLDRELTIGGRACPSATRILDDCYARIIAAPARQAGIMHGDLCFSNILYNSRNQRICLIDPRGYIEDGVASPMGDMRYDMAKLTHSIVGRYDQIIAGDFRLDDDGSGASLSFPDDPVKRWLEAALLERTVDGVGFADDTVIAATITLFLSMIPLHTEDARRQRAFFINALRLHQRFFG